MSSSLGTRRARTGARLLRCALLGSAVALVAACGSTIPLDEALTTGLDSPGDGVAAGDGGLEGGYGSSGPGGALGSGGTGPGASGGGPGGGRGTATTLTKAGDPGRVRGVTAKEIRIGVEYAESAEAVGASFGAKNTTRDWRADFQIVIDHVNNNGGILGRTVKPEYFGYNFNGDWATQERAACEQFTRDVAVFAVVAFAHSDTVLPCFEKAGLIQIVTGAFGWYDERTFATYPRVIQAGGFSLDRLFGTLTDHLLARGFFTPDAKIGLVGHESPQWTRATDLVRRRLAAQGRQVAYVMELPEFHTAGDGQGFAAKLNTEMVKMKDEGVTHVVFVQQTITGALLFMGRAETQLWWPKYGISTNDSPEGLISLAPQAQVRNAIGAGFAPFKDVGASVNPGTPGAQRCIDIFTGAGVTWGSYSEKNQSFERCDHMLTLLDAIASGGEPITTQGTLDGLAKLGTSRKFATTFASDYRNGRRDGAAVMRGFAYAEACKCFEYVTEQFPVP